MKPYSVDASDSSKSSQSKTRKLGKTAGSQGGTSDKRNQPRGTATVSVLFRRLEARATNGASLRQVLIPNCEVRELQRRVLAPPPGKLAFDRRVELR